MQFEFEDNTYEVDAEGVGPFVLQTPEGKPVVVTVNNEGVVSEVGNPINMSLPAKPAYLIAA